MTATRRKVLSTVPALSLSPIGTAAADASTATERTATSLAARAGAAHSALMQGDLDKYFEAIKISDEMLLMTPFGGRPTRGHELSPEKWANVAKFFRNGRESTFDLLHAYESDDLVVLAALEKTVAEVGGLAPQAWALRVTLVFRKEGDDWHLVHRHADPLVDSISLQQAAELARVKAQ